MNGQTNIIKNNYNGPAPLLPDPPRKMGTPDKWYVTYDTQFKKDESVNQWVNEIGACKTAMAKTGLLTSICCAIFMKVLRIFCS